MFLLVHKQFFIYRWLSKNKKRLKIITTINNLYLFICLILIEVNESERGRRESQSVSWNLCWHFVVVLGISLNLYDTRSTASLSLCLTSVDHNTSADSLLQDETGPSSPWRWLANLCFWTSLRNKPLICCNVHHEMAEMPRRSTRPSLSCQDIIVHWRFSSRPDSNAAQSCPSSPSHSPITESQKHQIQSEFSFKQDFSSCSWTLRRRPLTVSLLLWFCSLNSDGIQLVFVCHWSTRNRP